MTPAQIEALRDALPAFGEPFAERTLLDTYTRYYALDFSERFEGVQHQVGVVSSGPYSLATHRWTSDGATSNLLLMHGYFDHTGIFGKLIAWALEHRCNVLMFDLPGHGLSSGEPVAIDDFAEYAQAIQDVLAAVPLPALPLWAMGQSTGGAALIEYARRYDWPFDATVLLAPLIRPVNWPVIRLARPLVSLFTDSVSRGFADNSSDKAFLAFLRQEPLQSKRTSLRWVNALRSWLAGLEFSNLGVGRVLIVQGDKDGTVDWRYNVPKLQQLFPECCLETVAGAGHQLANESEALRAAYLRKVEAYLEEQGVPLNQSAG